MIKKLFSYKEPKQHCTETANESLSKLGEFESVNMINAYVSHQELIENCFQYNTSRSY